jgi:hypothetical protein
MLTSFITQALTFPTIFFTGLLALMFIYWLFVMFGALDLDFLGGKLDGMAEAATGKLDAIGDVAHGKLEGMADAAAAKVEGAVDAIHATHQGLSLLTIFSWLGIGKVPVTITLSAIALIGWVTCMLGMRWVSPILDPHLPHWVGGILVFVIAVIASIPVTRISTKPMERFFVTHEAGRRRDLVGRSCRISTGHVDERFGQATIEDGADAFVIQVRAEPEQKLARGQDALIIAYDAAQEAYRVEGLTQSERQMLAKDPTV